MRVKHSTLLAFSLSDTEETAAPSTGCVVLGECFPLAATKKEASVAGGQHGVRSVPDYKTGGTGRAPPKSWFDVVADTEVALIPITDLIGKAQRGRSGVR